MATYTSILKPNVFITFDEVKEWLDIQDNKIDVPADPDPFPKPDVPKRRRRLETMMNTACQKIESILNTVVIAKTFQEDLDGNDSNVFVPSKWPILTVEELFIDYNRSFNANSILEDINYILRGTADTRQSVPADLRIVGNDIYLRADDEDNVIGRVFAGSEAGAIRIKYKAGWANDIDDVPFDLRQAAVLLTEWYWFKHSNRDLGISSKGVRGESYTKFEAGIPKVIHEMIQEYISYSFGTFEKHQNNIMGV